MMRCFTLIKTVFICGVLLALFSGCSEEERSVLARQQVGVVLKLNLCDDCPFQIPDSLKENMFADSLAGINYKALVEVCFFNDTNKVREYITSVHRIDQTTWQTDTIKMINPGLGSHILQRIVVFEEDVEHPLYSAVNSGCSDLFATQESNKLPQFIELGPEETLNRLVTLHITLFNTGLNTPAIFGYDKWCTHAQPAAPLTIVVCNTRLEADPQNPAARMTGRVILSELTEEKGVSKEQKIEEQVFVEEVKTNIQLPTNIRPEALFELRIFIPDEKDPLVMIADTLTGKQLKAFRESGFWLKEDEPDPDAGLILFDLSRLPEQSTGLISTGDTLHDARSWTPSYIRR